MREEEKLAIEISRAFSHARTMEHAYGYDSREARDAREDLADLHERARELATP